MSMFDDYIEHAGAPPKPSFNQTPSLSLGTARGPLSPTGYGLASGGTTGGNGTGVDLSGVDGYEGFERDGEDEQDEKGRTEKLAIKEARLEALDSFHLPIASTSRSTSSPIFSLSPVQFSLPNRLLSLTVNANILVMGIFPLSILIIDLERPGDVITVELPKPAEVKEKEDKLKGGRTQIDQVLGDPTGRHLIVNTTAGDAFYISTSGLATTASDGQTAAPRRARLMRLRHAVTCIAWPVPKTSLLLNPGDLKNYPTSTECLLGGPAGQISTLTLPLSEDLFNLKGVTGLTGKTFERDHITLYTLPDGAAVDGLAFGTLKAESSTDKAAKVKPNARLWILATTRERMYEFQCDAGSGSMIAKGGWAEELIKKYKDTVPKLQEIPGQIAKGQMRVWTGIYPTDRKGKQPASSGGWLSPSGIYYSSIPSTHNGTSSTIDAYPSASLLPYPPSKNAAQMLSRDGTQPDNPISLLLTEWHFVLLFADGRISAFSRLTERMIWEERLPLRADEQAVGMSSDLLHKTFWVHTDESLYEVVAREEDRDVWRAKLDKKHFDEALRYARTPRQLDIIRCRQADDFFEEGRYMQAAQTYAMSSRSFEYVTLRFVDKDERDALRVYLSERLDQLDKAELTQRMMLATWLVEIYLSKLNTLEDIIAAEAATTVVDDMKMELNLMEEDTRNFMTTYSVNLDKEVMYDLLQSHGRVDLYLFFAGLLRDWDLVAEHWITEEKWLQAIEVINRQDTVELYYRFAALLMRNVPQETVDSWLRQPALDSRRLIPALLVHNQGNHNEKSMRQAIRYLHIIIGRGNTDVTIHNLLITLLVNDNKADDASLLQFLADCADDPLTGMPYYDLDYALRLCKQRDRIQPCVHIYSKMGLFESSVDLALERGDLELARLNADRPEDNDVLRKKLWLKIARYVVEEKHDIKSAIHLLELTDLLKIEDILPFFPDFVVIDDFKSEICSALEDYSDHIASLKAEMDEATRSAESIKQDIANLKNRFVAVDANERCSHCSQLLLTRQFYVFPCQHVFHADCLISLAKDYLPSSALRRIISLQNELIKLTSSTSARALLSQSAEADSRKNLFGSSLTSALAAGDKLRDLIVPDVLANAVSIMGIAGSKRAAGKNVQLGAGLSEKERKRVDRLREELDGLLAGACVLCEGSVQTLDKAFVTQADDDGSWDI